MAESGKVRETGAGGRNGAQAQGAAVAEVTERIRARQQAREPIELDREALEAGARLFWALYEFGAGYWGIDWDRTCRLEPVRADHLRDVLAEVIASYIAIARAGEAERYLGEFLSRFGAQETEGGSNG